MAATIALAGSVLTSSEGLPNLTLLVAAQLRSFSMYASGTRPGGQYPLIMHLIGPYSPPQEILALAESSPQVTHPCGRCLVALVRKVISKFPASVAGLPSLLRTVTLGEQSTVPSSVRQCIVAVGNDDQRVLLEPVRV